MANSVDTLHPAQPDITPGDRAPQRIELVIPAGTADQIASGQAVPSIPTDMVFVVGDTLVVKNEDTASHQLGPIWVPPGTSASLNLDTANRYSYACSFQPSRYLGLDVRSRVTCSTSARRDSANPERVLKNRLTSASATSRKVTRIGPLREMRVPMRPSGSGCWCCQHALRLHPPEVQQPVLEFPGAGIVLRGRGTPAQLRR